MIQHDWSFISFSQVRVRALWQLDMNICTVYLSWIDSWQGMNDWMNQQGCDWKIFLKEHVSRNECQRRWQMQCQSEWAQQSWSTLWSDRMVHHFIDLNIYIIIELWLKYGKHKYTHCRRTLYVHFQNIEWKLHTKNDFILTSKRKV